MSSYRHFPPLTALIPLAIGDNLKKLLNVIAKHLDMAEDDLYTAIYEFFPLSTTETIEEWEKELGISHIADNLADRRLNAYIRHKGEALSTSEDIRAAGEAGELSFTLIKHEVFLAGIDTVPKEVWGEEWRMRMDALVTAAPSLEAVETFRRRVAEFIPAFITGYIIYEGAYIPWR